MKGYCTRFVLLPASLALVLSLPTWVSDLPNPLLTPGTINTEVTQANIQYTICVNGYTEKIRPPAEFTNNLKRRQISEYGYADREPQHYEEDHLIALSIGGAPADAHNLWPEPRNSKWNASKKDRLEFVLYKMVCDHEIPLAEAQHAMATNWIQAWKQYVPSHKHYGFRKVD